MTYPRSISKELYEKILTPIYINHCF